MKITILTLFPEMFVGPFDHSIIKHAIQKNLVEISIVNIRNFGIGKHQIVDDTIYGGGTGMLMRIDVLDEAISQSRDTELSRSEEKVFLLSAAGRVFTQKVAQEFKNLKHIILICGHYEGVDSRIEHFIDGELSIGDFVVTGGELPAMIVTDTVVRLIDNVLKPDVTPNESFSLTNQDDSMYLEYPQYTKPAVYKDLSVPDVLLSGHHAHITTWRKNASIKKTQKNRPDLITKTTD